MYGSRDRSRTLNRLLYCAALGFDTEIVMSALKLGVSGGGLSGTGSAYTALVGRDQIQELKSCLSDIGGSVMCVSPVWCLKNAVKKFIYADSDSINTLLLRQRLGIS